MSAGAGRVQRWLVGYVERWEDDEDGYVSKTFLRAGWHLHEHTNGDVDEHPIPGLSYTTDDRFQERIGAHPRQRSHMESARRAISRLCNEGTFEQSPDRKGVRLPTVLHGDADLNRRLAIEREYLQSHQMSASDDVLVAIVGNIVVIELERLLTRKERLSFQTRCIERGDSPAERVERLVEYVATRHGAPQDQTLADAFDEARRTLSTWREDEL